MILGISASHSEQAIGHCDRRRSGLEGQQHNGEGDEQQQRQPMHRNSYQNSAAYTRQNTDGALESVCGPVFSLQDRLSVRGVRAINGRFVLPVF